MSKTAEEILLEHDCEGMMYFSDPSYDDALIGTTFDGRAIYDFDLMVEWLMKNDDMDEYEAADFICYNCGFHMDSKQPIVVSIV